MCCTKVYISLFSLYAFFYNQFSEASTYDIDVDHSNSDDFCIEFNDSIVHGILSNINLNKAMGPDKIHGRILKSCALPISKPLSYLLKKKL